MSKNVLVNKEVINAELNFMLSRLRSAIAYEGKNTCSIYLAGVHKETNETIDAMGIKREVVRWCTKLYAPKKGTKAWEALFKGSKVLADAKSHFEAKAKAEKEVAAAKAAKKAEKAAIKAEKEKAAAAAAKEKAKVKAEKEKAKAKAEKEKAKVKADKEKAKAKEKAAKEKAAAKAEKEKAKAAAAPKAEKKAKEKKVKAAPKAEVAKEVTTQVVEEKAAE